ncbi:MAG: type II toxin-antitoxin system RatA family toxin [Candidatus Dactylopiibacterium sp.]|nr:type II toxin-antitoxin system RatA family toxin [Candidatus Dactylopiibacterium sp.]
MAEIRKSVLVEHSADAMYALVDGIEQYPAFLPWCGGADVERTDARHLTARLHIQYHGIKAHFATVNDNEPGRLICMRLKDGPFRRLDGEWRFTPLAASASKVEFSLQYEFSNIVLEKVLGPVFNHIANSFVEAFIQRARQLEAQSAGPSAT